MQYSIVDFKKVGETETFRFDSEYFKPEYLAIESLIARDFKRYATLKDLKIKINASAFYPSLEPYYNQGKLPFLRVVDTDCFISYADSITIPEEILKDFKTLKTVEKGDIIVTKGGSVARVGLVDRRSAVCRDLIFFNSSKLNEVDHTFLFVFFLTSIYQKMLIRSSSMTAQPHLTLTLVKNLPIFNPDRKFKEKISSLYSQSKKLLDNSDILYSQAEQVLLSELRLSAWKPEHKLSFIKSFSDTRASNRIDAEYYQPMYEEIVAKVKSYKNSYKSLGEIIRIKDKNFTPKDETAYKYIELANISANGNINGFMEARGKELPTRARRKINSGDVVVSSIEGALSSIALVTDDLDNVLCSTGFFVIDSDKINSETLLVLLKSLVGQLQLKKGCSGTILTAISNDEFKKIILPEVSSSIQKEIKQKITKMYETKALSKCLLDIAKQGVEIAIEKSEKEAESWIAMELKRLNIPL